MEWKRDEFGRFLPNTKLSNYDDEWIKEHYSKDIYTYKLCEQYNEEHGTNIKLGTFTAYLRRVLGLTKTSWKKYTEEEVEFVKENYSKMSNKEFSRAFKERFGYERSFESYHTKASALGIVKPRYIINRSIHMSGQKHKIGDEVIEKGAGKQPYILVKIKSTGRPTDQWERKQRVVWEREHGPIPPDHRIIFLDGDTMNCNIENLACVPAKHIGCVMGSFRNGNNPETKRAKYKWAELYYELKEDKDGD